MDFFKQVRIVQQMCDINKLLVNSNVMVNKACMNYIKQCVMMNYVCISNVMYNSIDRCDISSIMNYIKHWTICQMAIMCVQQW